MQEKYEQCTLVILETSDLHGHVFPKHYRNREEVNGGLAKLASIIKGERERSSYSLLIDNGDVIQGTPLTYYYAKFMNEEKNPLITIMNKLEYDCAVIGNHEFNYGRELLQRAVNESKFSWLSANILEESSMGPAFGHPYIVKEFNNGLRVIVLGVTTHFIPNWEHPGNITGLSFEDALLSTKKWIEYIQTHEKYDLLVVSYHGGFERDFHSGEETEMLTGENQAYAMCHELKGIDILLTGHQHRMIVDKVNGVTIIQPGCHGEAIGKVAVTFEKVNGKWGVKESSPQLLKVMDEVKADPHIMKLTEGYEEATQTWLDQPICTIKGDMTITDPLEVRVSDHPLIEFLNEVQMDASGAKISCTALFDNQSRGFSEHVTMRDIVSNYIYPNTLKVIRISGQAMKDALEKSASYFMTNENGDIYVNQEFTDPKPQHYNYDMWEGIDYLLDIRKPVGSRVVYLKIGENDVQMDAEYEVVMNNYRAAGGGGYTMFSNRPVIKEIQIDMRELIANYMLKRKTIRASCNGNWKVIW
ncbi:bifunctional metallophosphatase/5'-nucleotidase [Bacillus sp. FJAT-49732]|uniref:Bifunctional metallophosphatase/5'-nucleotidase n=1 Tax=Lederbergia citrisecunda TaxID=2833583 RepID=A0A942TTV2_9BACI|nr:bifunctional UDP-sugar hydrolase/5'-nucleotidase [Lederbergia citrisecunda]MBS4202147.1 bifunctional metallophosphatase/5'-nucleotidase [Lederbergia citrisecunda]